MEKSKMHRLNHFGLVACAVYLALTLLVVWAWTTSTDEKGQIILLQLPIALQLDLIQKLGLLKYTQDWSYPFAYAVCIPVTSALLYLSGVAISHIWLRSKPLAIAIFLAPWLIAWAPAAIFLLQIQTR
jgi:hypothetical protein